VCGAHPIKLTVTWLVPDRAIKGKSQKRIESQGWDQPGFLKKKQPTCFEICFFGFLKRNRFLFFKKNTKTSHSDLFLLHRAISPFSELHAYNLLYQLWHSNLRVKKSTPSLFFQSVVGQFTPKWLGNHAHSKQKNHSHTNSAVSRQVYVHALLVQHLQYIGLVQVCPTFLVLRATFTWGNLLRVTNVFVK